MPTWRLLSTLVVVALAVTAPFAAAQPTDGGALVTDDAVATPPAPTPDSSASGSAASSSSPTSAVDPQDPESLAKATYRAITTKNWFLLAGCALSIVALVTNYALKKKWSIFENNKVKWITTGVLAGTGAIAHAWLADAPIASSQTFMGALRVFAAAVFAYVSAKKLMEPPASTVS